MLLPVLNNAQYIAAQIDSLAKQWRADLELLVLDDGSTDDSLATAARALARYPEISATLLRNETQRGVGNLDLILDQAAGEVIIQADSDDISLPGRLDAIMARFESDADCRLVSTNAVLLSADRIPMGIYAEPGPDEINRDPVCYAARIGAQQWLGATCAFDRRLLTDFPALDPDLFPNCLDMLLPFRAVLVEDQRLRRRDGGRLNGRDQGYLQMRLDNLSQQIRWANETGPRRGY